MKIPHHRLRGASPFGRGKPRVRRGSRFWKGEVKGKAKFSLLEGGSQGQGEGLAFGRGGGSQERGRELLAFPLRKGESGTKCR